MEEEKVFVHFSALWDVMEVKVWQNFSLAVQKLQTQFHSKVVLVLFYLLHHGRY